MKLHDALPGHTPPPPAGAGAPHGTPHAAHPVAQNNPPGDTQAREQDDVMALVAHELRNPLHALSLQLKLARITAQGRGQDEALTQIVKAQGMLDRYSERVTLLLDLVSLQPGALPVRHTAIDLAALVRRLCDELAPEAGYRGVNLQAEAPDTLLAHSDPVMLTQVLDNLVLNALKHAGCRTVRVALTSTADHASIEVRDDGRGIAAADFERIFGKFGLGSATLRGSGLGLWIVRKLLAALGGTVSLISTPGCGATFTVRLPLHNDRTLERAEGPA